MLFISGQYNLPIHFLWVFVSIAPRHYARRLIYSSVRYEIGNRLFPELHGQYTNVQT